MDAELLQLHLYISHLTLRNMLYSICHRSGRHELQNVYTSSKPIVHVKSIIIRNNR